MGLSWIGAAFAACGAAAGGLELQAEAAERESPGAATEAPLQKAALTTFRNPELGAAELPPAEPARAEPSSRAAVPLPEVMSPPPPSDTRMSEEQAAVHLAQAFRKVLGRPASGTALSLLWAHWAHETGRGRRMYGFNFGGLKGRGPDGAGFLTWTREAGEGAGSRVQRTFRAYPNAEAGARDYLELLAARFPSALRAARTGNVRLFVDALSTRGYFTDDQQSYERAITSLSLECRRRGLAESALLRLSPERVVQVDAVRSR